MEKCDYRFGYLLQRDNSGIQFKYFPQFEISLTVRRDGVGRLFLVRRIRNSELF